MNRFLGISPAKHAFQLRLIGSVTYSATELLGNLLPVILIGASSLSVSLNSVVWFGEARVAAESGASRGVPPATKRAAGTKSLPLYNSPNHRTNNSTFAELDRHNNEATKDAAENLGHYWATFLVHPYPQLGPHRTTP